MTDSKVLRLRLHREGDVVSARRRAKQIAELLGFPLQDQSRIATGVSEIARNALDYAGGGLVEFEVAGQPRHQQMVIVVSDEGPGILDLEDILAGRYVSKTGLGIGITGTRSLMDRFEIDTAEARGTTVTFGKDLPDSTGLVTPKRISEVGEALVKQRLNDPVFEMQDQNQELLQAMFELRRREEETGRLYKEAEAASQARDAMTAIVSHDLRNPLNAILMSSSFMLDFGKDLPPETMTQQLEIIRRSTRQANRLIEDLLDVTRIESGGLSIEQEVIPVEEVVGDACQMLHGSADPAGIELRCDADDGLRVFADRDRIVQVLSNLLANAIKFTDRGGTVAISARAVENRVRFVVEDTGRGMSEVQLQHVFDRFWQAERSDRRGVGLGLPIVKGIIEAHGGDVTVESRLGQGTRVAFDLQGAE